MADRTKCCQGCNKPFVLIARKKRRNEVDEDDVDLDDGEQLIDQSDVDNGTDKEEEDIEEPVVKRRRRAVR
jgi:hypothetical protein